MDIEKIKTQILSGKTIEEVLEKFNWREFEGFIEEIFKENNFKTWRNYRFKTKRNYEIDIIAIRNNLIFCVDCKSWSSGRYKKTGLKCAVKNQEERSREFEKNIKKNINMQKLIKSQEKIEIYPLIVTLLEEDLIKKDDTFIVPAWKLNSFLTEIEKILT